MKISAPRTAGSDLPVGHNVSRCATCQVAFAWKPAGPVASVTCPLCGRHLKTTTRRLAAGFVVLTPAQVRKIQDGNGFTARKAEYRTIVTPGSRWWSSNRWQAEKAFWAQIKGTPVAIGIAAPAPAKAPAVAATSPKLDAAVAALAAFDAKPRCAVCWGYNASVKKHATCGFCREWNATAQDQTAQGERRQYAWKRGDLVARVKRYGGTPTPAPVGDDAVTAVLAR
jgi:hypothetical protein